MLEQIDIHDEIEFSEVMTMRMIESVVNYYPLQLKILQESRARVSIPNEAIALNLLMLVSTTSFIESILYETIVKVIEKYKHQNNNRLFERMIKHHNQKLNGATFKNYEEIAKDLLGNNLSLFTESDTWEAIQILFMIRNQIAHGKDFSIEYTDSDDDITEEVSKNYKQVFDFLSKKKLVEKEYLTFGKLISDKVTDYFVKVAQTFFCDVTKNIDKQYNTSSFQSFVYLRSQLDIK